MNPDLCWLFLVCCLAVNDITAWLLCLFLGHSQMFDISACKARADVPILADCQQILLHNVLVITSVVLLLMESKAQSSVTLMERWHKSQSLLLPFVLIFCPFLHFLQFPLITIQVYWVGHNWIFQWNHTFFLLKNLQFYNFPESKVTYTNRFFSPATVQNRLFVNYHKWLNAA